MSDFGQPQPCRNSCGESIYFDRNSTVGHPSENKWIPLEYVNGIKTDQPHNCPNRKQDSKTNVASQTASGPPTQAQPSKEDTIIQLMNTLVEKLDILIKERQKEK
jgi:hypothetical protein